MTVLAAVSGGADSTALLICLHEYLNHRDATLVACHLNHGLRSAAGHAADVEAVRQSCGELGVALIVDELQPGAVRALASDEGSGIEAAARSLRYRFFAGAARAIGAGCFFRRTGSPSQHDSLKAASSSGFGIPFWSQPRFL